MVFRCGCRTGRHPGGRPAHLHPMPRISSAESRGHSPITGPSGPWPLEGQLVPVSGIQVISDLERLAVWVVVDVQHPDHRNTRLQLQSRTSAGVGIGARSNSTPRANRCPSSSIRLSGPPAAPRAIPAASPRPPTAGHSCWRSPRARHPAAATAAGSPHPRPPAAQPASDISRNRTPPGHQHPPRRHLPWATASVSNSGFPDARCEDDDASKTHAATAAGPHIRPDPLRVTTRPSAASVDSAAASSSGSPRSRAGTRSHWGAGSPAPQRPPESLPAHISQLQRKRAIRSRVKALRHHPSARARSACRASTTGQRTAQQTRKPSRPGHPARGQRHSTQRAAPAMRCRI